MATPIYTTSDGRSFVRTPDHYFDNLPDFPFQPNFIEIDGLQMHYLDEGSPTSDVVLLLHGQPDWSYLCLLYTSPSPRDKRQSRMPSSA